MNIVDILLLVIKSEPGEELRGRTLLQKKIYFLSVLLKENFGFSAHYYGPYSSFVAEHLDGLVNYGVIKEFTESFTATSVERNAFGEIRRHTYSLTADAAEMWDATQQKPEFSKWDKTLRSINEQKISDDFNRLSIAAKVHYIISWQGESTVEEVKQVAEEYGWDLDKDDIESILFFLEALSLVTTDESDNIPF